MITNFGSFTKSIWYKIIYALVVFTLFYFVADFLLPVFVAIALAFALYPLAKWFETLSVGKLGKLPKIGAIIMSFVVLGIALYIVADFLILPFFGEVNKLLVRLPKLSTAQSLNNLLDPQTRAALPSNIQALVDNALATATGYIMKMAQNLINSTVDIAANLIGMIIVPFLTFYFLRDWRTLQKMFINIFSHRSQEQVNIILNDIGEVLSSYVRGIFKLCLLVGICISIGTYFLGMQYPLVLGFIAIIVETIPVLGPILGTVPAVFIAYSQSPALALKVALFYLVFYQIDSHYLMPTLMGSAVNLHPVLIIVGILIGGKLFGIVGLLFAVPVVGICKVLYDHLWHMDEENVIELKKDL